MHEVLTSREVLWRRCLIQWAQHCGITIHRHYIWTLPRRVYLVMILFGYVNLHSASVQSLTLGNPRRRKRLVQ